MVKIFKTESSFDYPWNIFTRAIWRKYPNPFASHVLTSDVVDRYIDNQGVLHTTRIFLKKGRIPNWAKAITGFSSPEAYILETSQVDPKTHTMKTVSRNLSHTKVMLVEETQIYTVDPLDSSRTIVHSEARVISNTGWLIGGRIEGFGVSRFKKNLMNSFLGVKHVLEQLKRESSI